MDKKPKRDPTNIPKTGRFWNHDNRFHTQSTSTKTNSSQGQTVSLHKKKSKESKMNEKWTHDKFTSQIEPKKKSQMESKKKLVIHLNHSPKSNRVFETEQGNVVDKERTHTEWIEKMDSQDTIVNEFEEISISVEEMKSESKESTCIQLDTQEVQEVQNAQPEHLECKRGDSQGSTSHNTRPRKKTNPSNIQHYPIQTPQQPLYYNPSPHYDPNYPSQSVLMMTDTGLYVPTQSWNGFYYPSWNYPQSEFVIQPRVNKAVKIRKPS